MKHNKVGLAKVGSFRDSAGIEMIHEIAVEWATLERAANARKASKQDDMRTMGAEKFGTGARYPSTINDSVAGCSRAVKTTREGILKITLTHTNMEVEMENATNCNTSFSPQCVEDSLASKQGKQIEETINKQHGNQNGGIAKKH